MTDLMFIGLMGLLGGIAGVLLIVSKQAGTIIAELQVIKALLAKRPN